MTWEGPLRAQWPKPEVGMRLLLSVAGEVSQLLCVTAVREAAGSAVEIEAELVPPGVRFESTL